MKKFLPLLVSLIFFAGTAKAQYVTIPDVTFREILQEKYPSCFNAEGMMDTTCSAITSVTSMILYQNDISSVDGIQYFKSLSHFEWTDFQMSFTSLILPKSLKFLLLFSLNPQDTVSNLPTLPGSLDSFTCNGLYSVQNLPSLPNLNYLNCSNMPELTSLPILPGSLTTLICGQPLSGGLDSLPSLPNSLTYLDCSRLDSLFSLPVLPPHLAYLDCSQDPLISLPSLPNSLKYLNCSDDSNTPENGLISLLSLPDSLTYLNCSNNNIDSLPKLPNSLISLTCIGDRLSILPQLPPQLRSLNCGENQITNLPDLPNSLSLLDCSSNLTKTLPKLPSSIDTLFCEYNQLVNLPTLPTSITYLNCQNNQLINLPTLPTSITYLNCQNNQLVSLPPLPGSLIDFYCSANNITNMPSLPIPLKQLDCSSNQLTSLPTLPNQLDSLICLKNQLNDLPTLPNSLNYLDCSTNNLNCIPKIPDLLSYLYLDSSKVHCIPNYPGNGNMLILTYIADLAGNGDTIAVTPTPITLPLCNPTNNMNNCQEFPVMAGYAFYDNNSNGIKDPTELYMPYVQLKLSDGDYTFTNTDGYYQIAATDNLGSYALAAYAPTYYKAVPVITTYNFTSFDTLVTQDIAMQPTVFVDSLGLNIYSYHRFARPGSAFPVVVNYSNVGTTTLSPNISFTYDNTLLTYDSSSNLTVINTGNNLTLSVGSFVPGQSGSFVAYFSVKTNDVLGDSLKLNTTISANAANASDSIATIISSSYDPNDKEATPQLTPYEVAKGKPVIYTIRFQNTGNDTAFNVVIADTLNSLLLDSTVQMISSSKPCKVTVTGNVIYFEFLNIQLPDSAVNSLGSNGYVSFSVKPVSSLKSGSITNTAFIYFDYNSPVVTNTTTTFIQDSLSITPLRLLSFTALKQPSNNNTLLYWSTASELNTKSFIIEQSADGVNFIPLAIVAAKGSGSNSYSYNAGVNNFVVYYRLEMVDINGQYIYSPIIRVGSQDAGDVTLLPNPANKIVTIKTNDASLFNTNAKIINSIGEAMMDFILQKNVETIDISILPAGIYYLSTQNGVKKFIITK